MTTTFLNEAILKTARAALEKGETAFGLYCDSVPGVRGCTKAQVIAEFNTAKLQAERGDSFKALSKKCEGYKVPKSVISLLLAGAKHVADYTVAEVKDGDTVTTEGFTPKLTFIVELAAKEKADDEDKGIFKVLSGRVGTRAAKGGKVGGKSRISAFIAWEKTGKVKGDGFKILKTDGGYKVDGRFVQKGKLTAFLVKVHPKSHTVQKLRDYGQAV